MSRRSLVSGSMLVVLVLVLPMGAGAAPTPAPMQVVGTDPVSDWGGGGNNALLGHALSQDLLSASIGMPTADTVRFSFEVSFLPSAGGAGGTPQIEGMPEFTRYTWAALLDGEYLEIDGKFTNYSRGACDPTSGQCPPPSDPGERPFLIRGNCVADPDTNITSCEELARVQGEFNPALRTISVEVPLETIGAEECSVIAPGPNLFGGSISAAPSVFYTSSLMPMDTMELTEPFQVPTDDEENPCPAP